MEKSKMEKSKIIGWKIKDQFREVAEKLVYGTLSPSGRGYSFSENSSSYEKFKDLGVLELWFEPVFKKRWVRISNIGYASGGISMPAVVFDEGNNHRAYGWNFSGEWTTSFNLEENRNSILNTLSDEAVREMLIAEAATRGFKHEGEQTVNAPWYDEPMYSATRKITKYGFGRYESEKNELIRGNHVIFKNGKWAQVVKEIKIKEGAWYKSPERDHDAALYFFEKVSEDTNCVQSYGFNRKGEWSASTDRHYDILKEFEPATDKEVQKRLKEEAKKRGFVPGATFVSIQGQANTALHEPKPFLWDRYPGGSLHVGDDTGLIYVDGKWGRVLENPFSGEFKLPEIAGYTGKDRGEYFEWGCTPISRSWLDTPEFRRITELTVKIGGETITVDEEELNQIKTYIKKTDRNGR